MFQFIKKNFDKIYLFVLFLNIIVGFIFAVLFYGGVSCYV